MIVNDKGQIVGDDGFTWEFAYGQYYSVPPGPTGWGIAPARYYKTHFEQAEPLVRAQWELIHFNFPGGGFRTSTGHSYPYRGYSPKDCMRAAEYMWTIDQGIVRVLPDGYLKNFHLRGNK